jgi:Spy/CpxP family protein refolding chaperone
MKKTIILAVAFSIFSTTAAFAQTTTPPQTDRQQRAGRNGDNRQRPDPMADLNLTEAQQTQMKALNEEFRTKSAAIRNDATLTDDQKREKGMELRKAQNEKRLAILTPEQKKQWEEKMKEQRENRGNRK